MDRYRELWQSLTPLYEAGEAQAIVRLFLDVHFGLSMTDILCGAAEDIDPALLQPLMERLQEGEPVQYVVGQADFCGRSFKVTPSVLIPRPETAELCQWIKEEVPLISPISGKDTTTLLDIGTGSGCIATTLALDIPDCNVTALDISAEALDIARQNAQRLGATVHFVQGDILSAESVHLLASCGPFSAIVSNPPYIINKERAQMHPNVLRYEPRQALFVPGNDPLLFYRAIARAAQDLLKPDGMLFFEINPLCHDDLLAMFTAEGFPIIETRCDQFGRRRFIRAQRDSS